MFNGRRGVSKCDRLRESLRWSGPHELTIARWLGSRRKKIAMANTAQENWGAGDPYELYVGRWSRKVAVEFLEWISIPAKSAWVDIGCGTGALTQCILAQSDPQSIAGIDKAEGFVGTARRTIIDPRVTLEAGDVAKLRWESHSFDAAVSGLVLNFVQDPHKMLSEMARVTRPGGK